MQDLRQSFQYAKYMKKIGWQVEHLDGCQAFIKKIPLLGAFIKIQRPEKIPFSEINKLAKKYRTFCIKIEPKSITNHQSLITNHYSSDNSPYAPPKTLQIDLTPSKKEILAQMKKDARYSIRKAEKNKLQLIKVPLKTFHQAWKKFNHHRLWIPSLKWLRALKDSFGKDFLQLTINDPPLAGIILLKHDQIMYYYYAFSSREGQRLFAPYLLVWEGIKLARKQGCRIFDFEGIEDPRFKSTKSWRGFTHFKKSFGGKEVEYPDSFNKYRLPL
jgi:lipid II:glycine glycyltransferase (peptidoglycan interpeptide bridge formation enzyme)